MLEDGMSKSLGRCVGSNNNAKLLLAYLAYIWECLYSRLSNNETVVRLSIIVNQDSLQLL